MVRTVERLTRVYPAGLSVIVPLVAAGIGAGASVYQTRKAEEAQDENMRMDAMKRKESMALGEAKQSADLQRMKDQAQSKSLADDAAFGMQMSAMTNAAEQEKASREYEKSLLAQEGDPEYAAKFKPGLGGKGEDSSSDFLVPKIADDTGLVRNNAETSGGQGLVTPLAFAV